jgi:adenosylcobinamide-GDP ribazoletransferase
MKSLLLALSFLTAVPVNLKEAPEPGDLGRSAVWFPLIGILIGGLSGLVCYGLRTVLSPVLAAVLSTAVWIGLSGGLHLDGLADCFDGLMHPSNPQRRLEIMKDPRIGSFGGIGLILAIGLKIALLQSLPTPYLLIALPLAAGAGRWLLLPAGKQPLARPGGMGADFAAGLNTRVLAIGLIPVLALALFSGRVGLAGLAAACLSAWGLFHLAKKQLGGVTGDVFGLTVEIAEMVIVLAFCFH